MRIQIDPDIDALELMREHFLQSSFADHTPRFAVPRITEIELSATDCARLSPLVGRVIEFGFSDGRQAVLFGVPIHWVFDESPVRE